MWIYSVVRRRKEELGGEGGDNSEKERWREGEREGGYDCEFYGNYYG